MKWVANAIKGISQQLNHPAADLVYFPPCAALVQQTVHLAYVLASSDSFFQGRTEEGVAFTLILAAFTSLFSSLIAAAVAEGASVEK
mmetsp:Transcript_15032/g.25066  ORF Transcript_15032/g.25066 Transcript_15032/m.25066 type:complete len:87 (-) Transcript_15032:806-1066(-)